MDRIPEHVRQVRTRDAQNKMRTNSIACEASLGGLPLKKSRYLQRQHSMPDIINKALSSLEILIKAPSATTEDEGQEFKCARTAEQEYAHYVESITKWLRKAQDIILDNTAEPPSALENVKTLATEILDLEKDIEKLEQTGVKVITNSTLKETKLIVEETIKSLGEQLLEVQSWIEERLQEINDTMLLSNQFQTTYNCLDECLKKVENILLQEIPIHSLVETKKHLKNLKLAVTENYQGREYLAKLVKVFGEIGSSCSVGQLGCQLDVIEDRQTRTENKLEQEVALFQEMVEEWEQCEYKIKQAVDWVHKACRDLLAYQIEGKKLRERLTFTERLVADIAIQRAKVVLAVEKLEIHFHARSSSPEYMISTAQELAKKLDNFQEETKKECQHLLESVHLEEQYQQELAELRHLLLQKEHHLKLTQNLAFSPVECEENNAHQAEIKEHIKKYRQQVAELENRIEIINKQNLTTLPSKLITSQKESNILSHQTKDILEGKPLDGVSGDDCGYFQRVTNSTDNNESSIVNDKETNNVNEFVDKIDSKNLHSIKEILPKEKLQSFNEVNDNLFWLEKQPRSRKKKRREKENPDVLSNLSSKVSGQVMDDVIGVGSGNLSPQGAKSSPQRLSYADILGKGISFSPHQTSSPLSNLQEQFQQAKNSFSEQTIPQSNEDNKYPNWYPVEDFLYKEGYQDSVSSENKNTVMIPNVNDVSDYCSSISALGNTDKDLQSKVKDPTVIRVSTVSEDAKEPFTLPHSQHERVQDCSDIFYRETLPLKTNENESVLSSKNGNLTYAEVARRGSPQPCSLRSPSPCFRNRVPSPSTRPTGSFNQQIKVLEVSSNDFIEEKSGNDPVENIANNENKYHQLDSRKYVLNIDPCDINDKDIIGAKRSESIPESEYAIEECKSNYTQVISENALSTASTVDECKDLNHSPQLKNNGLQGTYVQDIQSLNCKTKKKRKKKLKEQVIKKSVELEGYTDSLIKNKGNMNLKTVDPLHDINNNEEQNSKTEIKASKCENKDKQGEKNMDNSVKKSSSSDSSKEVVVKKEVRVAKNAVRKDQLQRDKNDLSVYSDTKDVGLVDTHSFPENCTPKDATSKRKKKSQNKKQSEANMSQNDELVLNVKGQVKIDETEVKMSAVCQPTVWEISCSQDIVKPSNRQKKKKKSKKGSQSAVSVSSSKDGKYGGMEQDIYKEEKTGGIKLDRPKDESSGGIEQGRSKDKTSGGIEKDKSKNEKTGGIEDRSKDEKTGGIENRSKDEKAGGIEEDQSKDEKTGDIDDRPKDEKTGGIEEDQSKDKKAGDIEDRSKDEKTDGIENRFKDERNSDIGDRFKDEKTGGIEQDQSKDEKTGGIENDPSKDEKIGDIEDISKNEKLVSIYKEKENSLTSYENCPSEVLITPDEYRASEDQAETEPVSTNTPVHQPKIDIENTSVSCSQDHINSENEYHKISEKDNPKEVKQQSKTLESEGYSSLSTTTEKRSEPRKILSLKIKHEDVEGKIQNSTLVGTVNSETKQDSIQRASDKGNKTLYESDVDRIIECLVKESRAEGSMGGDKASVCERDVTQECRHESVSFHRHLSVCKFEFVEAGKVEMPLNQAVENCSTQESVLEDDCPLIIGEEGYVTNSVQPGFLSWVQIQNRPQTEYSTVELLEISPVRTTGFYTYPQYVMPVGNSTWDEIKSSSLQSVEEIADMNSNEVTVLNGSENTSVYTTEEESMEKEIYDDSLDGNVDMPLDESLNSFNSDTIDKDTFNQTLVKDVSVPEYSVINDRNINKLCISEEAENEGTTLISRTFNTCESVQIDEDSLEELPGTEWFTGELKLTEMCTEYDIPGATGVEENQNWKISKKEEQSVLLNEESEDQEETTVTSYMEPLEQFAEIVYISPFESIEEKSEKYNNGYYEKDDSMSEKDSLGKVNVSAVFETISPNNDFDLGSSEDEDDEFLSSSVETVILCPQFADKIFSSEKQEVYSTTSNKDTGDNVSFIETKKTTQTDTDTFQPDNIISRNDRNFIKPQSVKKQGENCNSEDNVTFVDNIPKEGFISYHMNKNPTECSFFNSSVSCLTSDDTANEKGIIKEISDHQPDISVHNSSSTGKKITSSGESVLSEHTEELLDVSRADVNIRFYKDEAVAKHNGESLYLYTVDANAKTCEDITLTENNIGFINTFIADKVITSCEDNASTEVLDVSETDKNSTSSGVYLFTKPNKEQLDTSTADIDITISENNALSEHSKELLNIPAAAKHNTPEDVLPNKRSKALLDSSPVDDNITPHEGIVITKQSEELLDASTTETIITTSEDCAGIEHSKELLGTPATVENIPSSDDNTITEHSEGLLSSSVTDENIPSSEDNDLTGYSEGQLGTPVTDENIPSSEDNDLTGHSKELLGTSATDENIPSSEDNDLTGHSKELLGTSATDENIPSFEDNDLTGYSEGQLGTPVTDENIPSSEDNDLTGHSKELLGTSATDENIPSSEDNDLTGHSKELLGTSATDENIPSFEDNDLTGYSKELLGTPANDENILSSEDSDLTEHSERLLSSSVTEENITTSEDNDLTEHSESLLGTPTVVKNITSSEDNDLTGYSQKLTSTPRTDEYVVYSENNGVTEYSEEIINIFAVDENAGTEVMLNITPEEDVNVVFDNDPKYHRREHLVTFAIAKNITSAGHSEEILGVLGSSENNVPGEHSEEHISTTDKKIKSSEDNVAMIHSKEPLSTPDTDNSSMSEVDLNVVPEDTNLAVAELNVDVIHKEDEHVPSVGDLNVVPEATVLAGAELYDEVIHNKDEHVPCEVDLNVVPEATVSAGAKLNVDVIHKEDENVLSEVDLNVVPEAIVLAGAELNVDVIHKEDENVPSVVDLKVVPEAIVLTGAELNVDVIHKEDENAPSVVDLNVVPEAIVLTGAELNVDVIHKEDENAPSEVDLNVVPEAIVLTGAELNVDVIHKEDEQVLSEVDLNVVPVFGAHNIFEGDVNLVDTNTVLEEDVNVAPEANVSVVNGTESNESPEVDINVVPAVTVLTGAELNVDVIQKEDENAPSEVDLNVVPEETILAGAELYSEVIHKEDENAPSVVDLNAVSEDTVLASAELNVDVIQKEDENAPSVVDLNVVPEAIVLTGAELNLDVIHKEEENVLSEVDLNVVPEATVLAGAELNVDVIHKEDEHVPSEVDLNVVPEFGVNNIFEGDVNLVDTNTVPEEDVNVAPEANVSVVNGADSNEPPEVDLNVVPTATVLAGTELNVDVIHKEDKNLSSVVYLNVVPEATVLTGAELNLDVIHKEDEHVPSVGDLNLVPEATVLEGTELNVDVIHKEDENVLSVGDLNVVPEFDVNKFFEGDVNLVDTNIVPEEDVNAASEANVSVVNGADSNESPEVGLNVVPAATVLTGTVLNVDVIHKEDKNVSSVVYLNVVPEDTVLAGAELNVDVIHKEDENAPSEVDFNEVTEDTILAGAELYDEVIHNKDEHVPCEVDLNVVPEATVLTGAELNVDVIQKETRMHLLKSTSMKLLKTPF
ncbi:uncharacterized protein LOC143231084 [Tachypleus tridentatus]|uniref:uncharacterized protein LOC143231084 n=1 Tax=Tachypleus tridentatus TaxID=6853 RepID=UPI003FD122C0